MHNASLNHRITYRLAKSNSTASTMSTSEKNNNGKKTIEMRTTSKDGVDVEAAFVDTCALKEQRGCSWKSAMCLTAEMILWVGAICAAVYLLFYASGAIKELAIQRVYEDTKRRT